MRRELEDYVDSLGLDAYLVGGAVRDELLGLESKDADFLVPGVDTDGLKAGLVGARFYPRTAKIRRLAPAGSSSRRLAGK